MPPTLPLKLLVTPALITVATLVGRRWGDALSGWLVGLPLTSGPVVFFLALDQGHQFAATASIGVALGVTSQAAFAVAYSAIAQRTGWIVALAMGTAAFALATAIFWLTPIPGVFAPLIVLVSLVVGIILLPAFTLPAAESPPPTSSDLPLRIVVATALVIGLTAIAPYLGPRLSGLLSPFPLYAAILAVFAQRRSGPSAARAVWRGLLYGLFAFLAFFSLLAATLVRLGLLLGFALAIAGALAVQALTLILLRPKPAN